MGFIVRPPAWQMRQARGAFAGRPQLANNGAQFSRVRPGRLAVVARPAALQSGRLGFAYRPTAWEVQHAPGILAGQAYQAQNDGLLPDTPMWRMLEFRYSLNASRFTYFHPNVARMIEQKLTMPPPPPVTPPPPTVTPPPPITPPPSIVIPPPTDPPPVTPPVDPPPGGQIIDPPPPGGDTGVVPEPSAFAMLLVAVAALAVFCVHMRIRARGRRWFGRWALPSRSPVA